MTGAVICGVDGVRRYRRHSRRGARACDVLDEYRRSSDAEQLLRDAAAEVPAELAIENGHPADSLLAVARERQASFLVLGNHGPRSSLLGSISADVARRASCPVVVVPPAAETARPQAIDSKPEVESGIIRFGPRPCAETGRMT